MANNLRYANIADVSKKARACKLCANQLPLGAKPIIQTHVNAKILIASQAPGSVAHASGVPFMDKSGERLRAWMGVTADCFYDPQNVAIVPMGFCYPGKGKSGDLPPIPQCAQLWQGPFAKHLPNIKLRLLIGLHSQRWHLDKRRKATLTKTVKAWREYAGIACKENDNAVGNKSDLLAFMHTIDIPLPHPSPRNNIWMAKNAWFEEDLLPSLKQIVVNVLEKNS